MAKSKARTLDEDKEILRKKIHDKMAGSDKEEGEKTIRSLRKRLKRIQRKVRSAKARIARASAKKASKKES